MKRIVCTLALLVLLYSHGRALDNVPFSFDPPGGLKADNVPLFIVMGFDDCMYPDGMQWVLDTLLNKKNPKGINNPKNFDGAPIHASFYVNSCYGTDAATVQTWKTAYSRGHEISNHTHDHDEKLLDGVGKDVWLTEMKTCHDWITANLGIKASEIWGFRTPFLAQSNNSFAAMDEMKFLYDCSITHEPKDYDRIFHWPYTLDKGTAPGAVGNYGNHPGMWEIPVYNAALDPSGYPHMCGMDFSIWPRITKKDEMVNVWKWSLDMRLAAGKNRAPLTMGMHPDLYSPSNDEQLVTSWPVKVDGRKAAFVEFVDYALSKPMVRFVSAIELIQWMRNPVGLDATPLEQTPKNKPINQIRTTLNRANKTVDLFVSTPGVYTITLSTLQGRAIVRRSVATQTTSCSVPIGDAVAGSGPFLLTVTGADYRNASVIMLH